MQPPNARKGTVKDGRRYRSYAMACGILELILGIFPLAVVIVALFGGDSLNTVIYIVTAFLAGMCFALVLSAVFSITKPGRMLTLHYFVGSVSALLAIAGVLLGLASGAAAWFRFVCAAGLVMALLIMVLTVLAGINFRRLQSRTQSELVRHQVSRAANKCPFCAVTVSSEAIRCEHCGSDLPIPQLAEEADAQSTEQSPQRDLPEPGAQKTYQRILKGVLVGIGLITFSILALCVIAVITFLVVFQSRVVTIPPVVRAPATLGSYPVVGTGQRSFWNSAGESITAPAKGQAFYGEDTQFPGTEPSYKNNDDGTISDLVTGLTWTQTPDVNGDGKINASDKLKLSQAIERARTLRVGGYSDWRLPTIKELYSLIDFNGVDPRIEDKDTSRLTPFIDTRYFKFGYGDTDAGERIIDAQVATSTMYVGKTWLVMQTMFGVNFADGRIKGYPLAVSMTAGGPSLAENKFYAYYVRGNPSYGVNSFKDIGDGTVTDKATKLMWSQTDSGSGMDWEHALAWVQQKNADNYLGHNDWRLPNVKELQSVVDYSRSPATMHSPAIDPVFQTTKITNEAGQNDYGNFWSSTTHLGQGVGGPNNTSGAPAPNTSGTQTPNGEQAAYISFGRGMGKMFGLWMDAHGAGAQRSDPKAGNPLNFPNGFGPQGDSVRINNYVRLVRTAAWQPRTCTPTSSASMVTRR
jgi:hypothetical protein